MDVEAYALVVETDGELLGRFRDGDEEAFVMLVARYNAHASSGPFHGLHPSVAEEAVQDTWMGVVRGIDRFEGRSSLKTWLFRILVNRARSAGSREHRDLSLSDGEPAVDPSRFDSGGAWAQPLESWADVMYSLVAATWSACLREALGELPPRARPDRDPPGHGGAPE